MSRCVLRSFARRQLAQPAGANKKGTRSSNRKTFVSLNATSEESRTLPKIVNVSSLASSDDVKFSNSVLNYRQSQHARFFYHLPIHCQVKLLTRLKDPVADWPSTHELAQEINIPVENLRGWLNHMKSPHSKISALENIPQFKIDLLNDEFALSEILGEDKLTLLSYILKIEERVIQEFFDSKRDCKRILRPRPAAVSASRARLNAAAFGNFLIPCLRLTRCAVPLEKPSDFSDNGRRRIFTSEQLMILRDEFSRQEFPDREEVDRIVRQLGTSITPANVMKWFSKNRYRQKSKAPTTTVKIEPRLEALSNNSEKTELRSNRSEEKLETLDGGMKTEPRLTFGPLAVVTFNALFEEYKKSPVLTAHRANVLQTKLKINSSRIHAFFHKVSALLRGKTENHVTKLLTSYPKAFLLKIAAEHRRSRYISMKGCQKLAKQLGTSRRIVADWFSNARLYELLSGNRFHPITKPLAQSPLVQESVKARKAEQSSSADAASNEVTSFEAGDESNKQTAVSNKKGGLRSRPSYYFKPAVREMLFNAFKRSSHLSPSSLSQICSASKLSPPQVCLWFKRTRRKLITVGTAKFLFQSDYRNLNFSQEQIMVLEEEFQKHPYEDERIKEELANQLNVKKGAIQTWFLNRRYYDLIVSGMPELVDVKRNKYFSAAQNESAEDTKNVDCQKSDSSSDAPEMATSNFISMTQNFEVRLLKSEDMSLNHSQQDFHPSVGDSCDLLDVTVVKEEQLSEEPNSPFKMETSLADVSSTENSSVICQTDSALNERANGSVPLSELLQRVIDNSESFTDDHDGTPLSQHPSVADGSNAVSQLDSCDSPKLCSLNTPGAEDYPYSEVKPAIMSLIKIDSTEETITICEAPIAVLEELSMGKLLPPVSKRLANDSVICKELAATPEKLSDGSEILADRVEVCETTIAMPKKPADSFNLLPDASIPLAVPVQVRCEVAAAREAVSGAFKSPSDVSKPLLDHSYIDRMETDDHEEVSDDAETMADCSDSSAVVTKPLVDDLDVGKTVHGLSEEPSNSLELLPDISEPQTDHLEISNSVAPAPEELLDSSEPSTDASIPLTDHLEVSNSVPVIHEELPDRLADNSQLLAEHSVDSNSVIATPEELPFNMESLPNGSVMLADYSNVSHFKAVSPEELPDTSKTLSDDSMPLADHFEVSNSVAVIRENLPPDTEAAIHNELLNGLDPLSDVPEPLVNHSHVLTNGFESPIDEKSQCFSTESPNSPKNAPIQLESVFSKSPATPKKTKPSISAHQRKLLLREFRKTPFVSAPRAQMLAANLNLPVTRIKLWFRQRRCKDVTWMASKKLVGEKSKPSESSLSFSPFQLFVLEREFGENSTLTTERVTHLCQKLRTTRKPIVAWFQERLKKEEAKM